MADDPLTYHSYLKLEQLLSLQRPVTECKAELLFITVHHCVELLWRVALNVNNDAIKAMEDSDLVAVANGILQATHILQASTQVAKLLAIMTVHEFAEFREKLGTASGLQSSQFRELEIQGGLPGNAFLTSYTVDSWEYRSVKTRLDGTSLRAAFFSLLERYGLECSGDLPDQQILRTIGKMYTESQFRGLANIADALYSYDEAFGSFRWEHFHIVQRIIGGATGTGGTSSYLQRKLLSRFFPELVTFRTEIFS
jgi:tryptophan 2,3-dioxygenase